MKKRSIRLLTAVMALSLMMPTYAFAGNFNDEEDREEKQEITHGTAEEWILESQLESTPPADYVINKETQGDAKDGLYNQFFLEQEIQTVRIEINENNLNYLLQNADDEPYVMTDSVTIGDVTLGYCGLRTKGSYTLSHSYTDNPGSDRFSFTVNFGKYIKKKQYGETQNFFGCNKISFNNFFFDKSMMKEFFALKLMDEMGLPTPQYGLAKLYINGQYYGVYAMVEAMDESILEQYYGVDEDELSSYLCKPEGTNFLYESILKDDSPLWEGDEDTYKDVEDMLPTVKEWVRKLNCLHEGTDFEGRKIDVNSKEYIKLLEQVYEVDEVVKYFAVHSWLCQLDNMFVGKKNFGLYVDQKGVATILPWDYDLSFGCYYPSTAEATANFDIDTMYKPMANMPNGPYANYPMFRVIYQNEELMEMYHGYMKECSQIAALGGKVKSTGKTYEPGYFNSFIETMQQDIYEAAEEDLAENVYYMNRIRQPRDVKEALPNLSKIIAMRAVGVYTQVEGIETVVSAFGCDLSTLGNAIRGNNTAKGILTSVDAATGIFATANYTRGSAPKLSALKMHESHVKYDEIKNIVGCAEEENVVIYTMKTQGTAEDGYTLTIPLSQDQTKNGVTVYSYCGEKVEKLSATMAENLCTVALNDMEYIIIVPGKSDGRLYLIVAGILLAAGVIGGTVFIKKRHKK